MMSRLVCGMNRDYVGDGTASHSGHTGAPQAVRPRTGALMRRQSPLEENRLF